MTRPSSLPRLLSFFQHGSSVMRCHSSTMQCSYNILHPLRSGSTVRLSEPQGFWDEILTRHAVRIPGPLVMKTRMRKAAHSSILLPLLRLKATGNSGHTQPCSQRLTHTHTIARPHLSLLSLRPPCFNCHTLIEELL